MEVDSADELPSQTVSDHASGPSTVSMDVDIPESAVSEGAASPSAAMTTNLKDVVQNSCGIPSPAQVEQLKKATETTMMECGASRAIPTENIESVSTITKQTDKKVAEIVKRPLSKSCDDCVDLLLSQNFDRASSPCILTIVAYVQNILSDPSNPKFRSINIANKTFQGKISKVSAALELLQSIGFTEVPVSNTLCITAPSSSLESSLKSLVAAMDRLQIPLEDRPKPKPPKSSFTESQQNTFRESWDPYKSSFVSTAPQPFRGGKSVTEVALMKLHEQRRKMEGTLDSIKRRTEVLMPSVDGTVPSVLDYLNVAGASEEVESVGPSDSTLIAHSLSGKLKKLNCNGESDEPMTTAAVRELRLLQKSRIYSSTLIRIKFPDRVCIQGYFHIRHTLLDVYKWVYSCLSSQLLGSIDDNSGCDQTSVNFLQLFELYTSPPRSVLQPYAKSKIEDTENTANLSEVQYLSLTEAQLVPAVLIYLSWGPTHGEHKAKVSESSSTSSASSSASSTSENEKIEVELGRYLSTSLLSQASSKKSSTSLPSESTAYPVGELLSATLKTDILKGKLPVTGADADGDSESRVASKGNKPKWLKIGK